MELRKKEQDAIIKHFKKMSNQITMEADYLSKLIGLLECIGDLLRVANAAYTYGEFPVVTELKDELKLVIEKTERRFYDLNGKEK